MQRILNSNNLNNTGLPPEGANTLLSGMQVQQGNTGNNIVRTGERLDNSIAIKDRNIEEGTQLGMRSAYDALGDHNSAKKPRIIPENLEFIFPMSPSSENEQPVNNQTPTSVQLKKRVETQRLPVAPSDPVISGRQFYNQALMYVQNNNHIEAEKAFQCCMAYPKFIKSLTASELGTLYQLRSATYSALGNHDEAKKVLREYLTSSHCYKEEIDPVKLGNLYYCLGNTCRLLKDNVGIIQAFRNCLAMPGYKETLNFIQLGNLYCYMGDAYIAEKNGRGTIQAYGDCLAVPGYKEALSAFQLGNLYYYMGDAYIAEKNDRGTIQAYGDCLAVPGYKEALSAFQLGNLYYYMGHAYSVLGNHQEAIQAYGDCLAIHNCKAILSPFQLGNLYRNLGDSYSLLEKYSEAKEHYTICLNFTYYINSLSSFRQGMLYRLLAHACFKTNNYDEAKKYFEISLKNADYMVDLKLKSFHQMKMCYELSLCYNHCGEYLDEMVYVMIGLSYGINVPDNDETKVAILSSYENLKNPKRRSWKS